MEIPRLCICLLTYDRLEYAMMTLRALLTNARYSGPLLVHIADDGSSPEYRRTLLELAASFQQVEGVSVSNSERGGYGASYNLAMQTVHAMAGIILPIEDDWQLLKPLNLDALVEVFFQADWVGCIRLGYLGFTQPLGGQVVHIAGQSFLYLDPDSPEPHVWAGHPRLETRRYERDVGPWTAGLNPGATEFDVAQRRNARQGVLWPLDAGTCASQRADSLFAHIGTIQARTDQRDD